MPRGTGQQRKEQDTEDTRKEDGEDGVEHEDEEDDRHVKTKTDSTNTILIANMMERKPDEGEREGQLKD